MPFSIAIVGAGPSGLTLARLLHVADIDVSITIFERDASPKSRFYQGGTLDLHNDTGLAALKKAGLWEQALKHLRYEGEELYVADKNATVLFHQDEMPEVGVDYARPEIDREVLKDLLLHSVKPELLRWGKTLQSIDDSTGLLTFRDGSTAGPFDLVVGCDGAWSKVRAVLTDLKPRFSGVCGFECHIDEVNERFPDVSKMVGRGSYFAYSDRKSMTAQRMGDGSVKAAAWVMKEESYPADTMAAYGGDESVLKGKVLEDFQDWAPEMRKWIEVGARFRPWPLYELPIGEFWEHKRGFSLVGDAASLMTPFAGEGVNKAMKDALELAEAIEGALKGEANGDVDEAVRKYEQDMFPRATKYQQRTMQNKQAMFRKNGAVDFMVAMVDVVAQELGYDLNRGWLAWVPFRTAMWCWARFWQVLGQGRTMARATLSR
ncbi:hypothetical protein LTR67_002222 [Exophiala xenobiotica]